MASRLAYDFLVPFSNYPLALRDELLRKKRDFGKTITATPQRIALAGSGLIIACAEVGLED